MKSVLISIQPKWCELIANGKKTVEVRKTKPKIDTPFKCYIYETKGLYKGSGGCLFNGRGKVIGEFVCDEFTYIEAGYDTNGHKHLYNTAFIEHRMCIPDLELFEYLYQSREKCGGWAWHISDLVIYEQPKELGEFFHYCGDNPKCDGCEAHYYSSTECGTEDYCCSVVEGCKPLKRPPQSWGYVYPTEKGGVQE